MLKKTLCALALTATALAAHANVVEGFENVQALKNKGFILRNDSTPVGPTGTTNFLNQGFYDSETGQLLFNAQAGDKKDSYLGFNYLSGVEDGTLADWLITPLFPTFNSGFISFYARGVADEAYNDNFRFGMSMSGGTAASDFVLSDIITATQGMWTKYTLNFTGTGVAGSTGRFGIVYTGNQSSSNGLAIDSLSYVPEPTSALLIGLGLAGLVAARRRKAT